MKPHKIKDAYGDTATVCAGLSYVLVGDDFRRPLDIAMAYTPAQSKQLRKALKRAEREIASRS